MMTIEEVESLRKNDPGRYLELLSVVGDAAIKALKKQEPMKVKAHHLCPACGQDVTGSGWYCWNCGQRLDWNARGADHRCSLGEIATKVVDMTIEELNQPEQTTEEEEA